MSSELISKGNIILQLNDPLSSQKIPIENLQNYIKENNSILIYLDDNPMPYLMKRTYFTNLLFDDYDYKCNANNKIIKPYKQYYNLGKLFLNVEENPNIVVLKSQVDELIRRKDAKKFKLISTGKTITTYPQINHKLTKYKYKKENSDSKKTKWSAIVPYTSNGNMLINGYLIRLSPYNVYYDTYYLLQIVLSKIGSIFGIEKKELSIKEHKINDLIEKYIYDLDYLFCKYASRSNGDLVVYRGVNDFLPRLKSVGDKMVFENYTSTTDSSNNINYGNVVYKIIVSEGVPYINTKKRKVHKFIEFPEDREILLPRNLVAELVENDSTLTTQRIVSKKKVQETKKMHVIVVRPMNEEQFDIVTKKCSQHTLYNMTVFDDNNEEDETEYYDDNEEDENEYYEDDDNEVEDDKDDDDDDEEEDDYYKYNLHDKKEDDEDEDEDEDEQESNYKRNSGGIAIKTRNQYTKQKKMKKSKKNSRRKHKKMSKTKRNQNIKMRKSRKTYLCKNI